jgi:hypothetical protein
MAILKVSGVGVKGLPFSESLNTVFLQAGGLRCIALDYQVPFFIFLLFMKKFVFQLRKD